MKNYILFSCVFLFYLNGFSQVGIGTTSPQSELDVEGTIRSRDLNPGSIQADNDGNIINGSPNSEAYTPLILGTNNAPTTLPADTLTFTTFNGNYSSLVTLPTAANSNAANRVGTYILIRKQSQLRIQVETTNTDLASTLDVGTNFGPNVTAIFMFDGYKWIFIKLSNS